MALENLENGKVRFDNHDNLKSDSFVGYDVQFINLVPPSLGMYIIKSQRAKGGVNSHTSHKMKALYFTEDRKLELRDVALPSTPPPEE